VGAVECDAVVILQGPTVFPRCRCGPPFANPTMIGMTLKPARYTEGSIAVAKPASCVFGGTCLNRPDR